MSPSSSRSLSWVPAVSSASWPPSAPSRASSASVTSTSCWLTTGPPTVFAFPSPLARPLASRLPHRLLPHHLSGGHVVLGLGFGFRPAQSQQPALFRAVLPGGRAGRGGR